jgi:hypothetical protein
MSKRYDKLTDQLFELLETEHGGCEETTCDISCAMSHNFQLWAIELFAGCGASSDEFNRLYEKLPKKKFAKDAEAERVEMCKIENSECPHCNAVTWEPEYVTDSKGFVYCGSCARRYIRPKTLHFDGASVVDAGLKSSVEPVAQIVKGNEAIGGLFAASFEMLQTLRDARATLGIINSSSISLREKKEYALNAHSKVARLIKKIETGHEGEENEKAA